MIFLQVDPNVVKPGWTPLIITILLAAAITLLMLSMRRHMRRISAPYRDEVDESTSPAESSSSPTVSSARVADESGTGGSTADTDRATGSSDPAANDSAKADQSA